MLRVGLTGGLGSGKSTVARLLRNWGAEVIEADELGRMLMEPESRLGTQTRVNAAPSVFAQIVETFGPDVVLDGRLNRARLAEIAFGQGRLQELNAIVHPAVIRAQAEWMQALYARHPDAVAVVESALIFEVERDARLRGEREGVLAQWRQRFDRVVVVIAPQELRVARYVARRSPAAWNEAIAAEARARMAFQIPEAEKAARADYVIDNDGDEISLQAKTEFVWRKLLADCNHFR